MIGLIFNLQSSNNIVGPVASLIVSRKFTIFLYFTFIIPEQHAKCEMLQNIHSIMNYINMNVEFINQNQNNCTTE